MLAHVMGPSWVHESLRVGVVGVTRGATLAYLVPFNLDAPPGTRPSSGNMTKLNGCVIRKITSNYNCFGDGGCVHMCASGACIHLRSTCVPVYRASTAGGLIVEAFGDTHTRLVVFQTGDCVRS